jgi:hypothetical protein
MYLPFLHTKEPHYNYYLKLQKIDEITDSKDDGMGYMKILKTGMNLFAFILIKIYNKHT